MGKIDDLYAAVPSRTYTDQLAAAGLALIPLLAKDRPAGRWKIYTYQPGQDWPWPGYGVRCGSDSGNLECLDFDAEGIFDVWLDRLRERDPRLHEIVLQNGTIIETPAKGRHLFYRCTEPVGGSQKLAVASEPFVDCTGKSKTCLIETRGEGAYAAIPPTAPECHPAGRPYKIVSSTGWYSVPKLDPGQREILLAVARSFDARAPARAHGGEGLPPGAGPQASASPPPPANGTRPGDDFAARGKTIEEMLVAHGWALVSQADGVSYMRRPGKTSGISATVGYTSDTQGRRALHVFSTNAPPFDTGRVYNPYSVYTILEHAGDFRASAKELAREGFGEQRDPPTPPTTDPPRVSCVYEFDGPNEDWDNGPEPQKYLFETLPKITRLNATEPKPYLPDNILSMMVGAGGVGKSWALTQMALSIAVGFNWLDAYRPTKTGSVLLVLAEENRAQRFSRIWHALKALGATREEMMRAKSKISSVDLKTGDVFTAGYLEQKTPCRTEFFDRMKDDLASRRDDWALVIFDPLARFAASGTELDAAFATHMIGVCEELCELPGRPNVMISHHAKKVKPDESLQQDAARGSSALTNGVRWQVNMAEMPIVTDHPKMVRMGVSKSNFVTCTNRLTMYQDPKSGVLRLATHSMCENYDELLAEERTNKRCAK